MREQYLLVCRDEERAIGALPALLGAHAGEHKAALDILKRVLAARGELADEGRRRLTRVEGLFERAGQGNQGGGRTCLTSGSSCKSVAHDKYQRLIKAAQSESHDQGSHRASLRRCVVGRCGRSSSTAI